MKDKLNQIQIHFKYNKGDAQGDPNSQNIAFQCHEEEEKTDKPDCQLSDAVPFLCL